MRARRMAGLVVIALLAGPAGARAWTPPDLVIFVDPDTVDGHQGRGLAMAHAIATACDRLSVDVARRATYEEVLGRVVRDRQARPGSDGPAHPPYVRRVPRVTRVAAFWAHDGGAERLLRVRPPGGTVEMTIVGLGSYSDFHGTMLAILPPGGQVFVPERPAGPIRTAALDSDGSNPAATVCTLLGSECTVARAEDRLPELAGFGRRPHERAIAFLPLDAPVGLRGKLVRHPPLMAWVLYSRHGPIPEPVSVPGPVEVARFPLTACGPVSLPETTPIVSLWFSEAYGEPDLVAAVRVAMTDGRETWPEFRVELDGRTLPPRSAGERRFPWRAGSPRGHLVRIFPDVEGVDSASFEILDFGQLEAGEERCLRRPISGYLPGQAGPLTLDRQRRSVCVRTAWTGGDAFLREEIGARSFLIASIEGRSPVVFVFAHLAWAVLAWLVLSRLARALLPRPPSHVAERVDPRGRGFRDAAPSRWVVSTLEAATEKLARRGLVILREGRALGFRSEQPHWCAPGWPRRGVLTTNAAIGVGTVVALDGDDLIVFCDAVHAAEIARGAEPAAPAPTALEDLRTNARPGELQLPAPLVYYGELAGVVAVPVAATYLLPALFDSFEPTTPGLIATAVVHVAALVAAATALVLRRPTGVVLVERP